MMPPGPTDSTDLARRWQQLSQEWAAFYAGHGQRLAQGAAGGAASPLADAPGGAGGEDFAALWQAAGIGLNGVDVPTLAVPEPGDKRFAAPEWNDQPYFKLLLQTYLLNAQRLRSWADTVGIDATNRRRLQFAVRQYLDAIAPSNFPATNPEAIKLALATGGESLRQGLANLETDIGRGRIAMTDEDAYRVGENLAITPGAVVLRNDLIELIQYAPATTRVHARPLLIVPPCINKYYILDLQPENSFVRHAVAQGHTVFMISWRNIPAELGKLTWDDYIESGVLAALAACLEITRAERVNVLGFCVGGTLLACALAVLAARGETPVASATFLTTMLDFSDPGEIGVYLSEEGLALREPALMAGGRIHGAELATAFASLRANELVWNYVVNNYLKGRKPPAFDLLHWNSDSANLPGPMYVWYLRNLYLGNRLREPGALSSCGSPIDLRRIDMPVYVLATREDHIVPWESAWRSAGLFGGPLRFVLGASGHIAGVVNPPAKKRRSYRTGPPLHAAADPARWLAQTEEHAGSWWGDWTAWLREHAGRNRLARANTGSSRHPPIGPAPGIYVGEKVDVRPGGLHIAGGRSAAAGA